MKKTNLQFEYSTYHTEMYDTERRKNKAKKTVSILSDYLGGLNQLESLSLLDIGCSTGIMTSEYASMFNNVKAIDIDEPAIKFAIQNNNMENVSYYLMDSMNTTFKDNNFDIITCTHIYEHVPDSQKLLNEIFRILKPGGICFFSAGNRLNLMEPHYRLPLLSIIPKPLAHLYLRFLKKGDFYYETHLTYLGLKKLVSKFDIIDYTIKVTNDPKKYHTQDILIPGSRKQKLAKIILKYFYFLSPTYLWVLKK